MTKFNLYNLKDIKIFEQLFLNIVKNEEIVVLCVGTKKYFYDSFGVICGDRIKNINIYCYGSSKREVNGLNFKQVYAFIKSKHKTSKIVVIDSVFSRAKNPPILILKNGGIIPSGINNKQEIGDVGILFNMFSYHNTDIIESVINFIENMIKKYCQN